MAELYEGFSWLQSIERRELHGACQAADEKDRHDDGHRRRRRKNGAGEY